MVAMGRKRPDLPRVVAGAWIAGCAAVLAAPADTTRVTLQKTERGTTANLTLAKGCVASLGRAVGGTALRYRNECEPSLAANLAQLQALLQPLVGDALPAEVTRLEAGRLLTTWPELSLELALAALKAPNWDSEKARRNDRFANEFVRDLAAREQLFRDLDAVFRPHGRSLRLLAVEKVLLGRADDSPHAAQLQARGVRGDRKVPYDAQLFFELAPAAAGN